MGIDNDQTIADIKSTVKQSTDVENKVQRKWVNENAS